MHIKQEYTENTIPIFYHVPGPNFIYRQFFPLNAIFLYKKYEETSIVKIEKNNDIKIESNVVKKKNELEEKLDRIFASSKPMFSKRIKKISKSGKIRKRKSKDQLKVLISELDKEKTISRSRMDELAKETGLKPLQIYKWFWDHKRSIEK